MNKKNILITTGIALILVSAFTISTVAFPEVNLQGDFRELIIKAFRDVYKRLKALEQEASYVRTVRFLDPSEHTIDTEEKTKIATFTLTPDDPSNNAILNYWFYFEYKLVTIPPFLCYYEIHIHGETGPGEGSSKHSRFIEIKEIEPSYEYTHVQKVPGGTLHPVPNQSQYTIEVYFYRPYGDAMQVRNFNLIMTYADGIPAST